MKIPRIVSMLVLAVLAAPATCLASHVDTSTIEQPVNLGTRSDPTRIPLGGVPVLNNYRYGVHQHIFAARPCPGGPMHWDGGTELDQNLASVFGISVDADITLASKTPVTLHLNRWKPPVYSPYTREQVLAATLWCVLRAAGNPKDPLEVVVTADNDEDKPLEAKYSGKYTLPDDWKEAEVCPVKVPGTVIEKDDRGFAWVVFPDVPRKDPFVPLSPAMIVTTVRGDGDNGWIVTPVWSSGGDGENSSLKLNSWAIPMYYSSWNIKGLRDANSFVAEGGLNQMRIQEDDKSCHVELFYPVAGQETLAANILALVAATQPTESKPLVVSIHVDEPRLSEFAPFRNLEAWSETHHNHPILKCTFVWDPKQHKLTKGSVPLVQMGSPGWISRQPEAGTVIVQKGGQPQEVPLSGQPEAQPETQPVDTAEPGTKPESEPESEVLPASGEENDVKTE